MNFDSYQILIRLSKKFYKSYQTYYSVQIHGLKLPSVHVFCVWHCIGSAPGHHTNLRPVLLEPSGPEPAILKKNFASKWPVAKLQNNNFMPLMLFYGQIFYIHKGTFIHVNEFSRLYLDRFEYHENFFLYYGFLGRMLGHN